MTLRRKRGSFTTRNTKDVMKSFGNLLERNREVREWWGRGINPRRREIQEVTQRDLRPRSHKVKYTSMDEVGGLNDTDTPDEI